MLHRHYLYFAVIECNNIFTFKSMGNKVEVKIFNIKIYENSIHNQTTFCISRTI